MMPAHDVNDSESSAPEGVGASPASTGHDKSEAAAAPIGYGRPPKHSQFAKGKSGNPNGRPKGSRNFGLAIEDELDTKIPINENGKRKLITKREAVAKQLVHKAASGDTKAIPILLNEARAREKAGIGLEAHPNQRVEDRQVMSGILKRIRRELNESTRANSEPAAPDPPIKQAESGNNAEPPEISRRPEETVPIWAINLPRP
jgi:Family of unknown function (DUF5681)